MYRTVKQIIPAFDVNMGGIILKQALPTNNVNQIDPFLLLHHGKFKFNALSEAMHQGIGPHPHRGFSPVTFVIEGEVHHRDSRGNNQIAKKGEVQWMNAGAGIIHSERPSKNLIEQKGKQEIVQLWINTPANKKMKEPQYQYLPLDLIPTFNSDSFVNKLLAGNYRELKGKIKTDSALLIIWSQSHKGGSQALSVPTDNNCMLYVIKGDLKITGFGNIEKNTAVVFENNAEKIEIATQNGTQFLLLAGQPINEPMVQQGPFVMNTQSEILEAMRDYQMGKMGYLVEE